jgi:(2R)-sulfolactate sulfo-lyase subunit alpha
MLDVGSVPVPSLTRQAVWGPLIALAMARTVALVESGEIARDDGEFVVRGLFDLESDGVELFDRERPPDTAFYDDLTGYLVERVGPVAADAQVLVPAGAEAIAGLQLCEGARVTELLGLPGAALPSRRLDRAVLDLITHQGGRRVQHKFLIHKRGDHVGVAVADIEPGEHAQGVFMDDDSTIDVEARAHVPLGHKIALSELGEGAEVLEYGIPIGIATQPLQVGTYVHTHNLRSARW